MTPENFKNITISLTDDHTIWVHGEDDVGIELSYYNSTDLRENVLLAVDYYFDKHPN